VIGCGLLNALALGGASSVSPGSTRPAADTTVRPASPPGRAESGRRAHDDEHEEPGGNRIACMIQNSGRTSRAARRAGPARRMVPGRGPNSKTAMSYPARFARRPRRCSRAVARRRRTRAYVRAGSPERLMNDERKARSSVQPLHQLDDGSRCPEQEHGGDPITNGKIFNMASDLLDADSGSRDESHCATIITCRTAGAPRFSVHRRKK